MAEPGIVAVATYVPAGRLAADDAKRASVSLPPGVRSIAVPDSDEDAVTMAVEAAARAIDAAGLRVADIDGLTLVTCSSPYAEHGAATEVARALDLPRSATVVDVAGDTRGVVAALRMAADGVELGRVRHHVVVGADRRRGRTGATVEALGAGAAAVVVGQGGAAIGPMTSWRHGVPTRWRPDDAREVRTYDDPRYEREGQIVPAVRAVVAGAAGFVAIGHPDARSGRTLARAVGLADVDVGDDDVGEIGDAGSAAPLFSLARCLERGPAETGRLVAFSPGSGADAVELAPASVAVRHGRPGPRPVDYVGYLRAHWVLSPPPPPDPIVPWAATPGAARDDLAGACSAVRCQRCDALTIPAGPRCVECHSTELEPAVLPATGRVVTYNVQHATAVHPEPSPIAVGVARFAGADGSRGGQVSAMFVEGDHAALRVGAEVELAYRRQGCDDGLVKYGWKFRMREGER